MSEKRETILRLTQDATGKITDVKIFQETPPEKPLTVIELKPETEATYLRDLTEDSVVDWGDGTKSTVTAAEAEAKEVRHTYATTSTANRIVTIDGVIDRTGDSDDSPFDTMALTVVRSLGKLSGDVNHLFSFCGSLTAISAGLFDHCTAVTNFGSCFYDCNSLTAIPEGLFDHCTAVTDLYFCFYDCSSLTAIPAGLFDHCTVVTNFFKCFYKCSSLTGETPYTIVDGKKVKLWERSPENGFVKTSSDSKCFIGCTGLSDYAEIPYGWKQ